MEMGSMINTLMAGTNQPEAAVGMGATMCMWSDRHAGTIVKVTKCQIHVQRDKATRTDANCMSECQTYQYEADTNGAVTVFRKTKRGWRSRCGYALTVGCRREYYDYSF
jgi:hypothetical protein